MNHPALYSALDVSELDVYGTCVSRVKQPPIEQYEITEFMSSRFQYCNNVTKNRHHHTVCTAGLHLVQTRSSHHTATLRLRTDCRLVVACRILQ